MRAEAADATTERFDHVIARFEPRRRDDLKPGVAEWIGREIEWSAPWPIEEEDGGPYVGQYAFGPSSRWSLAHPDGQPPFCWVPECDLVIVSRERMESWARADRGAPGRRARTALSSAATTASTTSACDA